MGMFNPIEFNKPFFIGYQEDNKGGAIALYNVFFPDHLPLGSMATVSSETLEIRAIPIPATPTFEEWKKGSKNDKAI